MNSIKRLKCLRSFLWIILTFTLTVETLNGTRAHLVTCARCGATQDFPASAGSITGILMAAWLGQHSDSHAIVAGLQQHEGAARVSN